MKATTTLSLTATFLGGLRPTVATTTLLHYRHRLDLMAAAVPDQPDRVTARHLRVWLARSRTPATYNAYLTAARRFWGWAALERRVPADPTVTLRRARIPRTAPRAFTTSDADTVMAATHLDLRLQRAVSLMVQEGLRVGEVVRARWEDHDPARGVLAVRGKGGRGEITRAVPLSAQTRTVLGPGLRRGPIVPNHLGRHYTPGALSIIIAALIRGSIGGQPGDGRTAHALRHTAATHMVDAGADLRDVQAVLGHASVATTERYTSGAVLHLAAAVSGRWYGPPEAA